MSKNYFFFLLDGMSTKIHNCTHTCALAQHTAFQRLIFSKYNIIKCIFSTRNSQLSNNYNEVVLNNSKMKKIEKRTNKKKLNSTILKFISMIKSQVVRIPFSVPMPINNYGSFTAANGICVWIFFFSVLFFLTST